MNVNIILAAIAAAVLVSGCSETTGSRVKQDWRTIHQPAPVTPGGSDGHGN
jgi:PBP1b-binding outer membrane lipoprotein LpoB